MIVKGIVLSGGGNGTGLLKLEKPYFKLGDLIMINFLEPKLNEQYFANIVKVDTKQAIHIPKKIVGFHGLLKKKVKLRLKKVRGFSPTFGREGRIYIPLVRAKQLNLKRNDIVLLTLNVSGKKKRVYCRVRYRNKFGKEEYYCFTNHFPKNNTLITIEKIKKQRVRVFKDSHFLDGMTSAVIGKNKIIIFEGRNIPAIVNPNIKLSNLAYYIGAYFADGTKKGNSWAICASSPEQAIYYRAMHNSIIVDSSTENLISFTDNKNKDPRKLSKLLIEKWRVKTQFDLTDCKVRINPSTSQKANNLNAIGTFVLKENRGILLTIYNRILNLLLEKRDRKLALEFILGTLEGDGTVNAKKRGHIQIITNKNDYKKLEGILEAADIRYMLVHEKNINKFYIRIGALEILRNFLKIYKKVFKYYPKRRKALIERLSSTGAAKYILGRQNYTTGWVKAELKKSGILDTKYNLTKKGLKIKQALLNMENEMKSIEVK